METLALINGLRFIDSFFPSGGYAFSSGLEAAVHQGAVTNAEELDGYVRDLLEYSLAGREGVAAGIAHQAAVRDNVAMAIQADIELDAMKSCLQTRAASRQMGRQVMQIAAEQIEGPRILADYWDAVKSCRSPGHMSISMGLTLGAFGWKKREAIAAFLYHTAVGMVSAAHKLLPIGQRESQRLLRDWMPLMAKLSGVAENLTQLHSWSPVQDIYAMRQSRLTVRLFRS